MVAVTLQTFQMLEVKIFDQPEQQFNRFCYEQLNFESVKVVYFDFFKFHCKKRCETKF